MTRLTVEEAAAQLPELLRAVLAGETVELVQDGKPVASLVAMSEQDHAEPPPLTIPIDQDPCIGMWADRKDMTDGAEWVRELRAQEWGRF